MSVKILSISRRTAALGLALLVLAPLGAAAQRPHRGGPRWPMRLLSLPEVQRELRLSSEQVAEIESYSKELFANGRQNWEELQRLTPEERERRFAAMQADQERRVDQILRRHQEIRFRELQLQKEKIRAIAWKDVADDLKLTPEQRRQVEVALDGEHEAFRAAFQNFKMNGAMTVNNREEARRRHMEVVTATDARLNAILTEGQRKQLQGMQGAPFKFPEWPFRPRRQND